MKINACNTILVTLAMMLAIAAGAEGCDCGSTDPSEPCTGNEVSYSRDGHQITFSFQCDGGACACGRFANDWDFWVAPKTNGGDVTVTGITPTAGVDPDTGTFRHGAERDPAARSGQGFTESVPSGVNRMEPWVPERNLELPLSIDVGDLGRPTTILKAIDFPPEGVDDGSPCNNSDRQCLQYVETLTIVAEPPGNVFRPPYFGDEKPLIPADSFSIQMLSNLHPLGSSISWEDALNALRSVHLEHNRRSFQQGMTPRVNAQVSRGYDQFPNTRKNLAMLKMLEDPGSNAEAKRQLGKYIAQHGIDLFYIHNKPLNAGICGAWEGAGGFNGGNLLPIVLAAVMLDRQDWLDHVNETLESDDGQQCFAETGFIQRNLQELGKGIPTFGHLSTAIYPTIGDCNGRNRNCASVGGSSQASLSLYDGLADGDPLGNSGSPTAYQRCCTHGNWLAAALLAWLNPAVDDAFPDNARHFLHYMELRKRKGDREGYHFVSFNDPESDAVVGFDSGYMHEHFLALWREFESCFPQRDCSGMHGAVRPSPPVLSRK